jgi:hypothetical protein
MRNNTRIDSLEERLSAERPFHNAPDGFTDRVLANLPRGSPPPPKRAFRFWPRFAIGFAGLALGAVISVKVAQQPPKEPSVEVVLSPVPSPEPLNISIPQIHGHQFEQLTRKLDEPLEKELQNVISDTRVAIQFVASSFLPEK